MSKGKTSDQMTAERRAAKTKRRGGNGNKLDRTAGFSLASWQKDQKRNKDAKAQHEARHRQITTTVNGWLDQADKIPVVKIERPATMDEQLFTGAVKKLQKFCADVAGYDLTENAGVIWLARSQKGAKHAGPRLPVS